MTNVSKSSSSSPTRHDQPPKKCNTRKKVLMILDHSEGASKVRETRKRTETHKLIRNRIVSLKSVAKPPRVAKQILHFVN